MFQEQYHLIANKAFRRFTLSCMLAMFGNGVTYIVMVWALMRFNASVVSTATLMTCFWLPNVVLGPFFGVIADRWNRKKLLLIANGARAFCLFSFAFIVNNHMTALAIYGLASILGTVLASYIPVAMTFVREVVSKDNLLCGNALVDIAYELGAVMGMGGAGLILANTSYAACFILNGFCYLLAMLMLCRIPYCKNQENEQTVEPLWSQFLKGGRYILQHVPLLLIYLTQALFFICYMTAPVLLAPFAKLVLHSNARQFGWLEAMLSLGIIIGGFLSPWLAKRFSLFRVIMVQVILGILGFYLFSHTLNSSLAIFYHFLIGISFSCWALITTLAQEMTDLDYQGRVQSLFNSFSGAVIILFYYILAQWKDAPITNLYFGEISLLLLAIVLLILMLFKQRRVGSLMENAG